MPAREQFANQVRADEAGSPGDETFHFGRDRMDSVAAHRKMPQNYHIRPLDLS